MIAVIGYALAVALLFTFAALAAEKLVAMRAGPRRFVWIVAIVASLAAPVIAMLNPADDLTPLAAETVEQTEPSSQTESVGAAVATAYRDVFVMAPRTLPSSPRVDSMILALWALSSGILLFLLAAAGLRAKRLARHWSISQMNGRIVWLSKDVGPAVFGVLHPRIILPGYLADAPTAVCEAALAHEESHIAARDPLMLLAAQLLVVLVPWNLPLWWQLRRLRFAAEVDCDARVLRSGVDPGVYGETLLAVGQRRSDLPFAAVALTEPVSQLERRIRIMMTDKPRLLALPAAVLSAVAAVSTAFAVQLQAPPAPARTTAESLAPLAATATADEPLRIPPPKGIVIRWGPLDESLRALLEQRYPHLIKDTSEGTPIVDVLFNEDGSVERSEIRDSTQLGYSLRDFQRFGVPPEEVGYIQARKMKSPETGKKIYMVFGERKHASGKYAYSSSLGTRQHAAVQERVLQRYFPDVRTGELQGQPTLWVMLDRDGNVLFTGREFADTARNSMTLRQTVVSRFPEVRFNEMSMSMLKTPDGRTLTDREGKPVMLNYLWLAETSPLPGSWATN